MAQSIRISMDADTWSQIATKLESCTDNLILLNARVQILTAISRTQMGQKRNYAPNRITLATLGEIEEAPRIRPTLISTNIAAYLIGMLKDDVTQVTEDQINSLTHYMDTTNPGDKEVYDLIDKWAEWKY